MKYYTYVSLAKIEMLYGQIGQSTRETEASLGFDIKILKGEIKEKIHPEKNIFDKLDTVVAGLKKLDLVGDLAGEKPYLYLTHQMRFGGYDCSEFATRSATGAATVPGGASPIAFWGSNHFEGPFEGTALALAGSSYHLVGERPEVWSNVHSHSLTGAMTAWFVGNLQDDFSKDFRENVEKAVKDDPPEFKMNNDDVANGAWLAANQMSGQISNCEFVAKVLHRSVWPEGFRHSDTRKIILGSPLYVCLAE